MTPADAGALARKDLQGLGFFYASPDMVEDPARSAEKCAEAGAWWAAVLIESVDGRRQRPDLVARHADALRARGVFPILYTFPNPGGDLAGSANHAAFCAAESGCWHVCLDLEPFEGQDWTQARIDEIVGDTRRRLGPTGRISLTVFSRPVWSRRRWPDHVPVILQAYQRAADRAALARALSVPFLDPIPAIGTYLGDVARLRRDLENVKAVDARRPLSVAVWALATTDLAERAALRAGR